MTDIDRTAREVTDRMRAAGMHLQAAAVAFQVLRMAAEGYTDDQVLAYLQMVEPAAGFDVGELAHGPFRLPFEVRWQRRVHQFAEGPLDVPTRSLDEWRREGWPVEPVRWLRPGQAVIAAGTLYVSEEQVCPDRWPLGVDPADYHLAWEVLAQ